MQSREATSPRGWLVTPVPNANASRRLICFAYAGGGAALFRNWATVFPDTEVVAARLPGRESRFAEAPVDDFETILTGICLDICQACSDKPYVLFGYSLGSLFAYEVARHMRSAGRREAQALIVAARRSAHMPRDGRNLHLLPDAEFIQALERLEGTPPQLFLETELLQLLLPMVRADFKLHEAYRYSANEPLDCPLFVFGGAEDTSVPREELLAWRTLTRGSFTARVFPAGHFFIHSHRDDLLAQIATILESLPTAVQPRSVASL